MSPVSTEEVFVAGVDAGSTNTDCAIIERRSGRIIAALKSPTTPDPQEGILAVLQATCAKANVSPARLASIVIGTTHFLNAAISADSNRLQPVALIRLGAPYTTECPPFCDFPPGLRKVLEGSSAICKGGLQISGKAIGEIDEQEIRKECQKIEEKGLNVVAICGIYSPLDADGSSQEERVAAIVRSELPHVGIVCSRDVGQVGFLEREAATVLNASLLRFARITVASFASAVRHLGATSTPLFLTRNDGTLCSADEAARLPVRSFNAGSVASVCGAGILAGFDRAALAEQKGQIIVVDIGGTSTDVGVLMKSGFPRPAAAFVEVAGLRMNFSMPDVQSIALGGGSIVRLDEETGNVTVGADSVGYRLLKDGLAFGGKTPTATDVAVASAATHAAGLGDASLTKTFFTAEVLAKAQDTIKHKLQGIISKMKTTPDPATVILVGGGSIIVPEDATFEGVAKIVRPGEMAGCANALGAACARVAGVVDTIVTVAPGQWPVVLEKLKGDAVRKAVAAGAKTETVAIAEVDNLPIQYVNTGATRVIIKAVGDVDLTKTGRPQQPVNEADTPIEVLPPPVTLKSGGTAVVLHKDLSLDIDAYVPRIIGHEWYLSELDLAWIAEGSGVLGVGGGGSTYYPMIMAREILRNGGRIRIVRCADVPQDKIVLRGGFMGSPSVSNERLQAGLEIETAVDALCKQMGMSLADDVCACMSEEIGGGNGIQPLIFASSAHFDLPVLDCDLQGRAYPNLFQATPVAYGVPGASAPAAIADAVGNVVVVPSIETKYDVEPILRAACTVLGSKAFYSIGPQPARVIQKYGVHNTVSQCWWIGRALALCRQRNDIASIPKAVFEYQAGRVLFIGKVVDVAREVRSAFTWGRLRLVALSESERDATDGEEDKFEGEVELEFQNEWLVCRATSSTGGKAKVLAIVPDLITCLDTQSGTALGTHEVRYGHILTVIALPGDPKWYTAEGLDCGGPVRFDIEENEYVKAEGLGEYRVPTSVIETFGGKGAA